MPRTRDSDVEIIAEGLDNGTPSQSNPFHIQQKHGLFEVNGQRSTLDDIRKRVLCPSVETLKAIAKPGIFAATEGTFSNFSIPEYLDLGDGREVSQYEIEVNI